MLINTVFRNEFKIEILYIYCLIKINMEKLLFILSFLSLHYPLGLFMDTSRRFERFRSFNNDGKFENYCYENNIFAKMYSGNPFTTSPLFYIALLSSYVLSYLPLMNLLTWKWYLLLPLNIFFSLLGFIVAFLSTKHMTIYSVRKLNSKSIMFLILGIVLYLISHYFF